MAISISIDSYDGTSLYWTVSGGVLASVYIEKSTNGGVFWNVIDTDTASPTFVGPSPTPTLFRIKDPTFTITSNVWDTSTSYTMPVRTDISNENQITFCNSPIHVRLTYDDPLATFISATVYLWVWTGNQNKTLSNPNFTLKKDKVSTDDTYINFEISDLIKSFLITNGNNIDNPTFVYNELENPAIAGQGVFWQIVSEVTTSRAKIASQHGTNFSTLGFRWNYEQNAIGNNGISPNSSLGWNAISPRYYNDKIHNYISQTFDLTTTVATATSLNLITVTDIVPVSPWLKCSKDPMLIVYLNKLGLWDMFTPSGKNTVSSKIESTTTNRAYRDPVNIDNSYAHSMVRDNISVSQSYIINTGLITEDMDSLVEEIIYSPKVYLIRFLGDVNTTTTVGLTVDNTYVTVDDTTVTVDSTTITEEHIGHYKTHQQIPVVVTDTDFLRKTRSNDKNSIDYNIKFEETNNKINNIR